MFKIHGSGSGPETPQNALEGQIEGLGERAATRYLGEFQQVNRVAGGVALALPVAAPSLPGILIMLALASIVVLIYTGLCWLRPFRKCLVCDGKGRLRLRVVCFWCRGMKVRLRLGRRIYNRFAGLRAGDQLTVSRRLGMKE